MSRVLKQSATGVIGARARRWGRITCSFHQTQRGAQIRRLDLDQRVVLASSAGAASRAARAERGEICDLGCLEGVFTHLLRRWIRLEVGPVLSNVDTAKTMHGFFSRFSHRFHPKTASEITKSATRSEIGEKNPTVTQGTPTPPQWHPTPREAASQ